ncbi:isochorismatase family protein [Rosenbergiella nectarea]|uniref:isochorismatase family protein n=1 Tax=Rosenbergiella nectarea TaxID=988801 RepID=UPI001F4D71C3|nr:isochorismatase family protein [Rosenbergiella nectarea]
MFLQSEKTQVIFCDVHRSLINQSVTISPDSLVSNNALLAELCLYFQLPTTFLTVPVSTGPTGIIDSLQFLQTPNNTFHRLDADPFKDGLLVEHLASTSANTVVISGFAIEVGVMFTALGALQKGYRVMLGGQKVLSCLSRIKN